VFVEVRRRTCLKLFTQTPAEFRNASNFKRSAQEAVRKGNHIRKRIMWRQMVQAVRATLGGSNAGFERKTFHCAMGQASSGVVGVTSAGCNPTTIHGHVLPIL
jgi:hypothetical protein